MALRTAVVAKARTYVAEGGVVRAAGVEMTKRKKSPGKIRKNLGKHFIDPNFYCGSSVGTKKYTHTHIAETKCKGSVSLAVHDGHRQRWNAALAETSGAVEAPLGQACRDFPAIL